MSERIRILVADDHPVVRDGLVAMLGTQKDFSVVGEASTGKQVVEQAKALKPDVVMLDLEMPEMDGVQAIQELRRASPDTHVLVFTAFDTDERILGAVQAGAKGYMLKGAPRAEVFNAVRVINQGGSLLQPIVASKLMQHVNTEDSAITHREREVLELMARGKSNKDIASALSITERTAKFHVSSIMSKLDAHNRTQAVSIAAQRGLVKIK